jgi:hypothetical protein
LNVTAEETGLRYETIGISRTGVPSQRLAGWRARPTVVTDRLFAENASCLESLFMPCSRPVQLPVHHPVPGHSAAATGPRRCDARSGRSRSDKRRRACRSAEEFRMSCLRAPPHRLRTCGMLPSTRSAGRRERRERMTAVLQPLYRYLSVPGRPVHALFAPCSLPCLDPIGHWCSGLANGRLSD